jgi:transposase
LPRRNLAETTLHQQEQSAKSLPREFHFGKMAGNKGVGPLIAMACTTLCDPWRFQTSKQVAAYLGLVPRKIPVEE